MSIPATIQAIKMGPYCGDSSLDGVSAGIRGYRVFGIITLICVIIYMVAHYAGKAATDDKRKQDFQIVKLTFALASVAMAFQLYMIRKECLSEPAGPLTMAPVTVA